MVDVTVTLSEAEYAWFETVAAKNGVTAEEWMRLVLQETARLASGRVAANQDEVLPDIHEVPTRPDIKTKK